MRRSSSKPGGFSPQVAPGRGILPGGPPRPLGPRRGPTAALGGRFLTGNCSLDNILPDDTGAVFSPFFFVSVSKNRAKFLFIKLI